MIRRASLFALVLLLLHVGSARAQESYLIMERVAQKVIQHYLPDHCLPGLGKAKKPAAKSHMSISRRSAHAMVP
jgi:hypothetical protein